MSIQCELNFNQHEIGQLVLILKPKGIYDILLIVSNYKTNDVEKLSEIFKALSNPHRLSIFMRLARCTGEEMTSNDGNLVCECVGTLGKDLDIAPSTVSHHIKELRRAGLIIIRRRGQTLECSVAPDMLKLLADFFEPRVEV